MSFKDFKLLETIGKGSFASVHKVIRKSDNKVYALKRVKINKMNKKEIEDSLNEIRFLASIRHKNVVGFYESFLESNETELCIVMEFCGSGDLAQKVERYKRRRQYIDENVVWRYLIQCLKAVQYLHEKGICHRDIKAANTFLAEDGSVKIGDMNVSKSLKKGQLQTQIGTPYYMSPEIWNNKPYDASSDIWSLGCMIYELTSLRPPFLGDSFPTLKRAIISGRYPSIPRKYSEALGRVIGLMLKVNAKERPSASALLQSVDIVSRLQLDETPSAFNNVVKEQISNVMETIKVPGNLRNLNCALPKPCYPDLKQQIPSSIHAPVENVNSKPPLPPQNPRKHLEAIQNIGINKLDSNSNENLKPIINQNQEIVRIDNKVSAPSNVNKVAAQLPVPPSLANKEGINNLVAKIPSAPVPVPPPAAVRQISRVHIQPVAPVGAKPQAPIRYHHRLW